MKILNLLIISAGIITNFGINSSFATDNNQINNAAQQQVKTIKIGYDNVQLSNNGIYDFSLKCYKDFFSCENNKFASFEDCKFAPTYLGKLVKSFHDKVRTKEYEGNKTEIFKIKRIFSNVLQEIIKKTNNSITKHNFTTDQISKIQDLIKKAQKTIRISTNSNASEIKMWDYAVTEKSEDLKEYIK